MEKNKTGKYLKYAIGEIILVVIGILIALQINNWNENRKTSIKEQQLLLQLKSEFKSNLAQLSEKVAMREKAINGAYYILDQIDNPNTIEESRLYLSLWATVLDPTFDPIKNDIIETDNLRILRNDSLVRILSQWTSDVYQVQELELQYQEYRNDFIWPLYARLGLIRNISHELWANGYKPTEALNKNQSVQFDIKPSKKDIDFSEILKNVELESVIAGVITTHQLTNLQADALRERINSILELIESEIKP
jgi:hypothetical protein